jgi:hypothetical protein
MQFQWQSIFGDSRQRSIDRATGVNDNDIAGIEETREIAEDGVLDPVRSRIRYHQPNLIACKSAGFRRLRSFKVHW